jgi:hypothetical protein
MGMSFSRTSTYVAFYRMAYSSRGLKVRPFIPKGCLVLTGVPHPPSFSFGPPLHCHSTSWTSAMSAPFPRCSAPRRSRSPLGPLARRSHPAGMSSARPDPSQGPGALLPPPGARPCDMSRGQAASAWVRASRALRSLGVRRPTPGVANGFFFRHCLLAPSAVVSPALSWGEARPMHLPALVFFPACWVGPSSVGVGG